MTVAGAWELTIETPIGEQRATLRLRDVTGGLEGEAIGDHEAVPLHDIKLDGARLSWRQRITRPIRLNLAFEVTVSGDTMHGVSRAGRLPSSKVTGRRVAPR